MDGEAGASEVRRFFLFCGPAPTGPGPGFLFDRIVVVDRSERPNLNLGAFFALVRATDLAIFSVS